MNEFEKALDIVEAKTVEVPDVVYHGTNSKPFDRFKQTGGKVSTVFGTEAVKRTGFFFAPDEELARDFGKNVAKVKLHLDKVIDLEHDTTLDDKWEAAGYNRKWLTSVETWELFDGEDGEEFVRFLQKNGYDGAAFVEPEAGKGRSGWAFVAFDPKDIEILEWN